VYEGFVGIIAFCMNLSLGPSLVVFLYNFPTYTVGYPTGFPGTKYFPIFQFLLVPKYQKVVGDLAPPVDDIGKPSQPFGAATFGPRRHQWRSNAFEVPTFFFFIGTVYPKVPRVAPGPFAD